MISDINLLPQRKQNNAVLLGVVAATTLFVLLIGGGIGIIYTMKQNELVDLNNQIIFTQKQIEVEQQNNLSIVSHHAHQKLEQTVQSVDDMRLSSVYLLDQISQLLPQKAYVLKYDLQPEGALQIHVLFKSLPEVAQFHSHLGQLEWLEKVEMPSINSASSDNAKIKTATYSVPFTLQLNKEVLLSKIKEEK